MNDEQFKQHVESYRNKAAWAAPRTTENHHMTYEEAMDGHDVSAKQAKAEVLAHGVDWAEFVEEVGSKPVYKSNEVLEWLGY